MGKPLDKNNVEEKGEGVVIATMSYALADNKKNPASKPVPTTKEAIEIALKDMHDALLENVSAGKAAIDANLRKNRARFKLLKAKERLTAIERELMEAVVEL